MRISLVYNEGAGEGVSVEATRRAIEAAGHSVVEMLEPTSEHLRTLEPSTELVVVAGGDGTVRKVAKALAGRGIPLALLPLGTANNIAGSLAIAGPTEELVARWASAGVVPLDLGVARGPWGERPFLEAVGIGLVAAGIDVMDDEAPHPEEGRRAAMLAKALARFRDVLEDLEARPYRLTLDGVESAADLLLAEVLNVRSVGPGLDLAPSADPGDGRFEVVTAGEPQRRRLERYVHDRLQGRRPWLRLPTHRASRVIVAAGSELMHVDDWTHRATGGAYLSVGVQRSGIEVLAHGAMGSRSA